MANLLNGPDAITTVRLSRTTEVRVGIDLEDGQPTIVVRFYVLTPDGGFRLSGERKWPADEELWPRAADQTRRPPH